MHAYFPKHGHYMDRPVIQVAQHFQLFLFHMQSLLSLRAAISMHHLYTPYLQPTLSSRQIENQNTNPAASAVIEKVVNALNIPFPVANLLLDLLSARVYNVGIGTYIGGIVKSGGTS